MALVCVVSNAAGLKTGTKAEYADLVNEII